jgi:hypothetical protein
MAKLFEVVPRRGSWDVLHNHVGFRMCPKKREAIRLALRLARMQRRMGDEAEIVLRDGEMHISHRYTAEGRFERTGAGGFDRIEERRSFAKPREEPADDLSPTINASGRLLQPSDGRVDR